jgi:hypothetical protein
MNNRTPVLFSLLALLALLLSACGAAAATQPPVAEEPHALAGPAVEFPNGYAEPQSSDSSRAGVVPEGQPEPETKALPLPTAGVVYSGQGAPGANPDAGRMIIKNADMRLQVEDTDVAIDRTTQLVGDLGGYIVSSRTWVQSYYEYNLKYATITIGLPVTQFERGLTRLRELSVQVLDESASGDDVTEQYVDLSSQLANLEVTRERIKTFLDEAKTVDEALRINQQLSDIERQIEQLKGQINYLQDRSAFSTITVNLEPKLPELIPTPTPTPAPDPWRPSETFNQARHTLTLAYRGIVEFLIWLFVVVIPILLPPVIIIWALWKLLRRRRPPKQG